MNIKTWRALFGIPALITTAVGVAAAPQYSVVDLGIISYPGNGLVWQGKPSQPAPPAWPLAGGSQCPSGINKIFATSRYPFAPSGFSSGDVAVGSSQCGGAFGEQAANWTATGTGTAKVTLIGVLPGSIADVNGPYSQAYGLNNVGDIVGASQSNSRSFKGDVAVHGFIYNNGMWTDLIPPAPSGPQYNSLAEAVNDSHEAVGWMNTISSLTGDVLTRAFVYTGGTIYNLSFFTVSGPKVLLENALWIDCQGDIAAVGWPAEGGEAHSYLLVRQGTPRASCGVRPPLP